MDHPGEKPKHAAVRELLEETGLKPNRIKHWFTAKRGWRIEAHTHFFIAQDCKKAAEPHLDGGEKIQVKLATFEQFLKLSNETTFQNRDLIIELLRAQVNKKKTAAFKKLIFG